MKFRYARHTTDLQALEAFYTQILGFEVLGNFVDHDQYNGIFLGIKGESWHLEFTNSPEIPHQIADEDDLLVFYPENQAHYDCLISNINNHSIKTFNPKNPYWQKNGILIKDPDHYGIIISKLF